MAWLPRRFLVASVMALAMPLLGVHAQAADKIPVVVSFSILGDLVRVLGAERVAVTALVGPDQDAHVFEPKPSDARGLLGAKLFVVNGLGFEPWADKLAQSAGYRGTVVVASTGVRARPADPHAWQDPGNVVLYVRTIAAALSRVDPGGAATYQANATAYEKQLQVLDAWAAQQFASIPIAQRKVVTSHDAFAYFAARYNIQFLAAQGINTHAEPSARQVAQLIQQIQREKIRAVFVENMRHSQLIAQISKDTGASMGASLYADALSAPDKPGATYLQMVRHNVTQLAAGMQRN
jgi:zinc/manganese transport system substrate-binding protein